MNRNVRIESRGAFSSHQQSNVGPGLHLAERQFQAVIDAIEDRIVHHCDRPDVEVRILNFLSRAHGPTTDGIASAMGISRGAAEVHLGALKNAGRIWGQRVHGTSTAWQISLQGRHFLTTRTH